MFYDVYALNMKASSSLLKTNTHRWVICTHQPTIKQTQSHRIECVRSGMRSRGCVFFFGSRSDRSTLHFLARRQIKLGLTRMNRITIRIVCDVCLIYTFFFSCGQCFLLRLQPASEHTLEFGTCRTKSRIAPHAFVSMVFEA